MVRAYTVEIRIIPLCVLYAVTFQTHSIRKKKPQRQNRHSN